VTSALPYAPFLATTLMKPLICIAAKSAAVVAVVVKFAAKSRENAARITAFSTLRDLHRCGILVSAKRFQNGANSTGDERNERNRGETCNVTRQRLTIL